MLTIKEAQESLVCSVLKGGLIGPSSAEGLVCNYEDIKPVGVPHIQLVLDQLVIAGCMKKGADERYTTTEQGKKLISHNYM